jgi:hypothetical protein
VEWTASEFISHDKAAGWYMLLAVGAILLAAILYVLTRDWVTAGVILVAAIFFGIYGSHKPRQLPYKLDKHGLSIGAKHFYYNEFRSFSIVPEPGFSSIVLMPLKRFGVPTTIYYSLEDEERIINLLASYLPLEERKPDAIDSLMRRVRF